ncbi:long-chain-fatty-acid--CoA ligase [Arhodomonas sp. SL1]|uniref:long-chain-fatty-acid--CoA ligase n=1 Tax=Arhodomonas sp. SL1 TaxID=3425691 RepID=UPI003F8845C2
MSQQHDLDPAERPWLKEYGVGVATEFTPMPDSDLVALIRRAAREHSGRTAFTLCLDNGIHADLGFDDVERASDAFGAWLRDHAGIAPGDRVALQTPNSMAFPVCAFGTFKAGAILVNVNPLYTAREMNHQLRDADARVLVIIDMFTDKLPEALAGTTVERVVTVSIADFFPWLKRQLVQGVQKHLRRQIPRPPDGVTPLARALRAGARGAGRLRDELPCPAPEDTAVLQYTGGTTGLAKGAELTHANLLANLSQTLSIAGPVLRPREDVVLTALPLYHIFAFTFNMLTFYTTGCRNILCPSPRPPSNLRRAFERFGITKFSAVNALFQGLLREPWFRDNPPRSIDLAIAGGTALHVSVAQQWQEVVGSTICEGYGLSETSPVVAVNPPAGEVRLGTIGVPVPGTEVRLVDEEDRDVPPGERGELLVRGPQVMRGYWRRPEETAEAMRGGWFHTGDVARMDERGYLTIVDRKKDMIDVNGFNVYPNEVEDVLASHPDIDEVAVVGVRDETANEHVHAFVVTHNQELGSEDIVAWARRELTAYKVPERIIFRDELPKSPVGKILRKDLRAPSPPD